MAEGRSGHCCARAGLLVLPVKRFYIALAAIGTAALAWALFLFGDAYIQYVQSR